MACAVLGRPYGFELSSETTAPGYLKLNSTQLLFFHFDLPLDAISACCYRFGPPSTDSKQDDHSS